MYSGCPANAGVGSTTAQSVPMVLEDECCGSHFTSTATNYSCHGSTIGAIGPDGAPMARVVGRGRREVRTAAFVLELRQRVVQPAVHTRGGRRQKASPGRVEMRVPDVDDVLDAVLGHLLEERRAAGDRGVDDH